MKGVFVMQKEEWLMPQNDVSTVLADIRERVVRVETKIDNMTDVRKTAEQAKSIATEALSSTKSAHKRLDKIDKMIFWLGTTVIGAVVISTLNLILGG